MAYTTVFDLKEKLPEDLTGVEYLMITNQQASYKISVSSLTAKLESLSLSNYIELKNKVIDDASNIVHADAIHFIATAVGNIVKGTPVKLINQNSNGVFVSSVTSNTDKLIGICEETVQNSNICKIMLIGVLNNIDVSNFSTGDILYSNSGIITNIPDENTKLQIVGRVIDPSVFGKILVTVISSNVNAKDVFYDNTSTELISNDVQSAITELAQKTSKLEHNTFNQESVPLIDVGEGDTWYDKTTDTLKVYREYPIGSNVYSWEPLLYQNNDTINGGTW